MPSSPISLRYRRGRRLVLVLAPLLLLGPPRPAQVDACPFCANMGKTLAENVAEASVVVYAKLSGARQIPGADPDKPAEQTDMTILKVVKDNPAIAGKQKIVLPRFIAAAEKEPVNYLLFAEIVDGKVDPYRGVPVDDVAFVDYLAEAVKLAKADPAAKLGFFFRHLDAKDDNVSGDAYKEFANAPYAEVVKAAKSYDPDKLIKWIRDKNTQNFRIGLYGCLLGTCGRPADAKLLKSILDDPEQRPLTGVDGLMGGYCILDPEHGPAYVLEALSDPKNDFNFRYAALRTVRFILTDMPKVDRQAIYSGLAKAVEVPDISDLVLDELRKNKVWSVIDKALGIYGKNEFDLQVIRRSVIRFALKCPDPKAQAFIAKLRKEDPQLVADVEEVLKFEESQQSTPSAAASPSPSPAGS